MNMLAKRYVTIAIGVLLVCVAINLFYIDAVFRWIANSKWLWKDRYPWVPVALGYTMLISNIVGMLLFFVCMIWGTPRQRLFCFLPGIFLLSFFVFICIDTYESW